LRKLYKKKRLDFGGVDIVVHSADWHFFKTPWKRPQKRIGIFLQNVLVKGQFELLNKQWPIMRQPRA